jgi:hypothetical protein
MKDVLSHDVISNCRGQTGVGVGGPDDTKPGTCSANDAGAWTGVDSKGLTHHHSLTNSAAPRNATSVQLAVSP